MDEQSDAETFGTVTFWYRNYRGEISRRVAAILGLRWGSSEYHKEPQWLLRAIDIERNAEREFAVKDMAPTESALAQSNAEPKGIDLDDADRAYDKWAEHRNGQSRLDAFRAGVEFGLRHTAPPRPDASGLIEAAEWLMERAHLIGGMSARSYREAASALRFRAANARGLQTKIRAADRSGRDCSLCNFPPDGPCFLSGCPRPEKRG